MRSLYLPILFVLSVGCVSTPAWSDGIPHAYITQAKEHSIPAEVLYAVARTESRRLTNQGSHPWPWTLNIAGEAFFLTDKASAIVLAQEALSRGESFGVGIMQIEWRFHSHRFESIEQALDPQTNLIVGAQILAEYIQEAGGIWEGVGRYHSKTPSLSRTYQLRVGKQLTQILSNRDRQQSIAVVIEPVSPMVSTIQEDQPHG